MIHITAHSVNELFVKLSKTILEEGVLTSPRGLLTKELQNVFFELHNPKDSVVSLPTRGISEEYLRGEFEWYKSGSLDVNDIGKHSSAWYDLADSNGTVNSNYGFLALKDKWAGISQLEWCFNRFDEDMKTRQAVINYNQPRHKYEGNKDFVCAMSQQFREQDGRLDSFVHMRSQDLIYGLTYDLPWFTYLQEEVAMYTGLPLGNYSQFSQSLHVYERHFVMLEDIAQSAQK